MKSKLILITVLYLLLQFTSAYAQSTDTNNFGIMLKAGTAPFIMQENMIDAYTNGNADKSPCKSIIRLDQPGMQSLVTYSIVAFNKKSKLNLELTIYPSGKNHISGLALGLGYRPTFKLTDNIDFHLCGNGNFSRFGGRIGQVGERDGDYHLEAPDGNIYYTGSDISVDATSYGLSLSAGLDIMFTSIFGIVADCGYRYATEIDKWNFNISSDDGDDEDGQSSDLPRSGFEQQPSSLDLSGLFLEAGIVVYF